MSAYTFEFTDRALNWALGGGLGTVTSILGGLIWKGKLWRDRGMAKLDARINTEAHTRSTNMTQFEGNLLRRCQGLEDKVSECEMRCDLELKAVTQRATEQVSEANRRLDEQITLSTHRYDTLHEKYVEMVATTSELRGQFRGLITMPISIKDQGVTLSVTETER